MVSGPQMSKTHPLARILLTLLVLSGCAPRTPEGAESVRVDNRHDVTIGVTVFGDARLGVAIN